MPDSADSPYTSSIQNEILLKELRYRRDQLLIECDWTQARDVTLSNDSDWTVYRQALRDVPQSYGSLDSAEGNWPTKPE